MRPPTGGRATPYSEAAMDARDITAENVAKVVGGTVERDGSVLCCCPIHEASGTHNPSLLLSIKNVSPWRRTRTHGPVMPAVSMSVRAVAPAEVYGCSAKCAVTRSRKTGDGNWE